MVFVNDGSVRKSNHAYVAVAAAVLCPLLVTSFEVLPLGEGWDGFRYGEIAAAAGKEENCGNDCEGRRWPKTRRVFRAG